MPNGTPNRFYKYMTAKAAKAVLENNAFRWSSPSLFNDPFDMQFDLHLEYDRQQVVNRVLDRFMDVYTGRAQPVAGRTLDEKAKLLRACMPGIKEGKVRNEHRAAIYETLRLTEDGLPKLHEELRTVLASRKLLCLSEIPDSLIMWAHYAENHAGAVIEVSYLEDGTYASTWGAAKPVRYTANMPRLADERALTRCLLGEGPLATPQQFQDSVYVKADAWSYEKEWRVFGGWENQQKTEDVKFRVKEMTAVYFGCRMPDATRKEIKEIMTRKYPHASIQNGSKSVRRFALEFAKAA